MKVLIVDDEPLVRRSLLRAFEVRGHKTILAADGPEGLATWRAEKPDAVLVDVLMPGLSGPDVVRQALADYVNDAEKPYVVLISAYSGEDSERLARDCGADRFISKPFEDIFLVVDLVVNSVEG